MKMSLMADFRLYEKEFERPNVYRALTKDDVEGLSVGGFAFVVDGKQIPFDWDAASCSEEKGVFHLETGYGPVFNDFEIPDYWDDEYAKMGLTRDQITAEFLASATKIDEFFINAYDHDDSEIQIGDNTEADSQYFVELLSITLEERDTGKTYDVADDVIKAFNANAIDYHKLLGEAYKEFRAEWYESHPEVDSIAECLDYTRSQFEACEFADDDYMAAHYDNWFNMKLLYNSDGERELRQDLAAEMADMQDKTGQRMLSVLVVEPGKKPYTKEIDGRLESLQHEVGGYIQAVYPFEEPVAIICNEEGKLEGLSLNRALRDEDGNIYDIIAGKFLVVGLGEEDFTSLTPELNKQFSERFKNPEAFYRRGNEIVVMPIDLDSKIRAYAEQSAKQNESTDVKNKENTEREI